MRCCAGGHPIRRPVGVPGLPWSRSRGAGSRTAAAGSPPACSRWTTAWRNCDTHAALEAFAFERTLIRPETGEWPDSRSVAPGAPVQGSWCHGAPGIALSRLCALDLVTDENGGSVVDDLDFALTSTCEQPLHVMDNLCCGNFGRADILLEASLVLENASLEAHARNLADLCLERAEASDFGIPRYSGEPHLRPGLWQGLAGIGYSLLRLAEPHRFSSLLCFR